MLIFLIVILLLAALLEYFSLRGGISCIEADFSLSVSRTEPGAPVDLTASVYNAGRLPISYGTLRIAFPTAALLPNSADVHREPQLTTVSDVFRLWGHRGVERALTFSVENRGVYSVAGRELTRGDFLGLKLSSGRFDVRRMLLVYPYRMENSALAKALGTYCGLLEAERWLIQDPVLTRSVRDYTGQEPMRTISWTQTARRGMLTVREFDYTRSLNCRVLFSVAGLLSGEDALLDRCCAAARTVCETLLEAGAEAQLSTNAAIVGYPSLPVRSVTAVQDREEDLLEVLARVTAAPCSDSAQLAEYSLADDADTAAYILITPHDDEDARNALRLLNSRGGMGALLLAVDALEEDQNDGSI